MDFYLSLFGFEYINCKVSTLDKRLVIPFLRKYGASIGSNCDIEVPLVINTKSKYENLIIGNNCYIGKGVLLDLKGGIELGNNVTISFGASIISHLDVGQSRLKKIYNASYTKTIVRNDVYVGANTTILNGVEIGENCVVCAGSVVKDSFPANTMIGGVPAHILKEIII
jgi:acetyltransferase-like isoleucine patch superfamily enzyme